MSSRDLTVEVTCTDCEQTSKQRLSWLDRHPGPHCPGCGREFRVRHYQMREIRHEFSNMERDAEGNREMIRIRL